MGEIENNEKLEKLKGLYEREMQLLKDQIQEKEKIATDVAKNNAKNEKQIEVQQKEVSSQIVYRALLLVFFNALSNVKSYKSF